MSASVAAHHKSISTQQAPGWRLLVAAHPRGSITVSKEALGSNVTSKGTIIHNVAPPVWLSIQTPPQMSELQSETLLPRLPLGYKVPRASYKTDELLPSCCLHKPDRSSFLLWRRCAEQPILKRRAERLIISNTSPVHPSPSSLEAELHVIENLEPAGAAQILCRKKASVSSGFVFVPPATK